VLCYTSELCPSPVDLSAGSDKPYKAVVGGMTWGGQFNVLFRRSVKAALRNWYIYITQYITSIVFGLLVGSVFVRMDNTQAGFARRLPAIWFCVINQGLIAAISVINAFPSERALVLRERAAGMYRCSSYFVAKTVVETLAQLPNPILFSVVAYPIMGLQHTPEKYGVFVGYMILCFFAATSVATM
jgi:ABC-type multidrug transport system permease subunit